MGQIVGGAAKPKRCNINKLSQLGTPAAGEHILVSSDNSMNAAGQGNFDCYIEGNGSTAATALELKSLADDVPTSGSKNAVSSNGVFLSLYDAESKTGSEIISAWETFATSKILGSVMSHVGDNISDVPLVSNGSSTIIRIPIADYDYISFTIFTSSMGAGEVITDASGVVLAAYTATTGYVTTITPPATAAFLYMCVFSTGVFVGYKYKFKKDTFPIANSTNGIESGAVSSELYTPVTKTGSEIVSAYGTWESRKIFTKVNGSIGKNISSVGRGTNANATIVRIPIAGYNAITFTLFASSDGSGSVITDANNIVIGAYTAKTGHVETIVPPTGAAFLYMCVFGTGVFTYYESKLNALNTKISIKTQEIEEIYLTSLLQKGATASGTSGVNTERVCCACVSALPYKGATFHFRLPKHFYVGIRCGTRADNLSSNQYWFENGDSYTFPSSYLYYRITFAKSLTATDLANYVYVPIAVAEVTALIESGDISIYYDKPLTILEDNAESEKYVKAIMRTFTGTSTDHTLNVLPIFTHISDIHGDSVRFKRFVEYSKHLDVDASLITGDMVAYYGSNGMDYVQDMLNEKSLTGMICLGNHDTWGDNRTLEAQYNNVMKRNIESLNAVVDSQAAYPTYYYKDITAKNIRVIALNEYDGGIGNNTTRSYYSQQQINWFISTLLSTPQNYGIVILFHSPEAAIAKVTGKDKFYQDSIPYADYQNVSIQGEPIAKIVDAFISGTTLNTSFTETNYATSETDTINIVADFTSKNSGVEFLFYACGHEHSDRIGYTPNTTNTQLVLNVTCGIALSNDVDYLYLAGLSDQPRGGIGSVQDAFNVYAVDRQAKTIRIARVGSDYTSFMTIRDWMIIPYA